MNRQPTPRLRHRRLDGDAVTARIMRVRLRRVAAGTPGWYLFPLYLGVLVLGLAVLTLPLAYFFFGTDVPFMVDDAGTKAPPAIGDRVKGGVTGLLCWGVVLVVFWRPVRNSIAFRGPHRSASRRVGFDSAGVWLAYRDRVVEGLDWSRVKAVSVVEEWQSTAVPGDTARPPFVEVFPVEAAEESAGLLGSMIVDAPPPRPGLRGKRYLIRLDCDGEEVRRLIHGLDGFAPGKRVQG